MVYSWLILLVAAGLVHMRAYTHSVPSYTYPLPPLLSHTHTHTHTFLHNVELHYSSSVISAVTLRSYCSLAMLSCPWTTKPHTACQLAHTDGEKEGRRKETKRKKEKESLEEENK